MSRTIRPTSPTGAEGEHPLAEATKETGQRTGEILSQVGDTATQQVNTQKDRAAGGIDTTAQAIRRVGEDVQQDQPAIATVAGTAAEQAERFATYLRDTDVTQMIRSVEGFARRQPALFLGGAFAIGLIAARLLKAAGGAPASQPIDQDRETWASGGSGIGREWEYAATGPGSTVVTAPSRSGTPRSSTRRATGARSGVEG